MKIFDSKYLLRAFLILLSISTISVTGCENKLERNPNENVKKHKNDPMRRPQRSISIHEIDDAKIRSRFFKKAPKISHSPPSSDAAPGTAGTSSSVPVPPKDKPTDAAPGTAGPSSSVPVPSKDKPTKPPKDKPTKPPKDKPTKPPKDKPTKPPKDKPTKPPKDKPTKPPKDKPTKPPKDKSTVPPKDKPSVNVPGTAGPSSSVSVPPKDKPKSKNCLLSYSNGLEPASFAERPVTLADVKNRGIRMKLIRTHDRSQREMGTHDDSSKTEMGTNYDRSKTEMGTDYDRSQRKMVARPLCQRCRQEIETQTISPRLPKTCPTCFRPIGIPPPTKSGMNCAKYNIPCVQSRGRTTSPRPPRTSPCLPMTTRYKSNNQVLCNKCATETYACGNSPQPASCYPSRSCGIAIPVTLSRVRRRLNCRDRCCNQDPYCN